MVLDDLFSLGFIETTYRTVINSEGIRYARTTPGSRASVPLLVSTAEDMLSRDYVSEIVFASTPIARAIARGSLVSDRAQVNYSNFGDVQHIHRDTNAVITMVYFANAVWKSDWMGELMFYDHSEREVVHAVTPVPGRLVVFDSQLPHRGGVPSRTCLHPRVTVAVKLKRDLNDVTASNI